MADADKNFLYEGGVCFKGTSYRLVCCTGESEGV